MSCCAEDAAAVGAGAAEKAGDLRGPPFQVYLHPPPWWNCHTWPRPPQAQNPIWSIKYPFQVLNQIFFFFYFFCLVVCLFIHFFSLVYPQRSSVNALHFPHVYFHKPVYVSTSSYICYLFWHVSEVAVIQFVAWGKVFIYSKVNTSAKKKQKTIFPACACSLRGKCPTVSALFTFKFRLWLTMNSKYTSVYCWCILLMSGENSDWQF